MDHFSYRDDELYAEDVALRELADRVGTPFFAILLPPLNAIITPLPRQFQA